MTIDALNQSPGALAHYIKHLANEPGTAAQFNRWKRHFRLDIQEWPCLLCEHVKKAKKLPRLLMPRPPVSRHKELCTSWPHLDFSGGNASTLS